MKTLMVGLGPVVDKDWNPKKFSLKSAESYMRRTMPGYLKRVGFVAVVADIGEYFRGSYAAMREARVSCVMKK